MRTAGARKAKVTYQSKEELGYGMGPVGVIVSPHYFREPLTSHSVVAYEGTFYFSVVSTSRSHRDEERQGKEEGMKVRRGFLIQKAMR